MRAWRHFTFLALLLALMGLLQLASKPARVITTRVPAGLVLYEPDVEAKEPSLDAFLPIDRSREAAKPCRWASWPAGKSQPQGPDGPCSALRGAFGARAPPVVG